MEKTARYPNALRTLIEMAGYSFKEVAKKANISERALYYWAAGYRVIPHQDRVILANVLGCTVEDLAPCQNSLSMIQLPEDNSQTWEQREMDKKRRELLQLLSIAGSILVLPTIAWEKVDRVISAPQFIDEAGLRDLEAINQHYLNKGEPVLFASSNQI